MEENFPPFISFILITLIVNFILFNQIINLCLFFPKNCELDIWRKHQIGGRCSALTPEVDT